MFIWELYIIEGLLQFLNLDKTVDFLETQYDYFRKNNSALRNIIFFGRGVGSKNHLTPPLHEKAKNFKILLF
jgi:ribosomal protein S2